jgi:hypothetical protein
MEAGRHAVHNLLVLHIVLLATFDEPVRDSLSAASRIISNDHDNTSAPIAAARKH